MIPFIGCSNYGCLTRIMLKKNEDFGFIDCSACAAALVDHERSWIDFDDDLLYLLDDITAERSAAASIATDRAEQCFPAHEEEAAARDAERAAAAADDFCCPVCKLEVLRWARDHWSCDGCALRIKSGCSSSDAEHHCRAMPEALQRALDEHDEWLAPVAACRANVTFEAERLAPDSRYDVLRVVCGECFFVQTL